MKIFVNPWKNYFTKRNQGILGVLLIAGLMFRAVTVYYNQFWRDEAENFFFGNVVPFQNLLFLKGVATTHPPLYFIFLQFWQKISYQPFFLRIPSLVASFFILLLVPVAAKKILPKSSILFPSLALFFFSFSHTQVSLNVVARPYPFVILLMWVSIILFLSLINEKNSKNISKQRILVFCLVNFLMFLTDYSSVWLLLTYWIFWFFYYLFFKRDKKLRWTIFKILLFTLLLSSLWLPILIKNLPSSLNALGHLKYAFRSINPLRTVLKEVPFFVGVTDSDIFYRFIFHHYLKAALVLSVLCMVGLVKILLQNKRTGLFLLLLVFCPVITSFLFSFFISPIFIGRNILEVNIALLFGMASFFTLFAKKKVLLVCILFLWLINFLSAAPRIYYIDPPYDWQKVASIVHSGSQKKYLLTTQPFYFLYSLVYYDLLNSTPTVVKYVDITKTPFTRKPASSVIFFFDVKDADFISKEKKYFQISSDLHCKMQRYTIPYLFLAKCV